MLNFLRGKTYSRPDIKERAGLSRNARGGNWDTGIVEHQGAFLIFANIGTKGRTGHDYGNRWEDACLRWYHKGGSHLGWSSVQQLLEPGRKIHLFWRALNDAPFEYSGMATPLEVVDTSPVEILWSFDLSGSPASGQRVQNPEQLPHSTYREGTTYQVVVNAYERNRAARQACIAHYGTACSVCGMQFERRYGKLGAGFIHVHHLIPLSELEPGYEVDPIKDLRPVCPNCHAIMHRRRPPLSPDELRSILQGGAGAVPPRRTTI